MLLEKKGVHTSNIFINYIDIWVPVLIVYILWEFTKIAILNRWVSKINKKCMF